jgi:diguanylate cyclase (GGDEF)-like protein
MSTQQLEQALPEGVLDALTAHIAVLDGDGLIVWVNQAWRRFALDSGLDEDQVGSSYLDVCERASAGGNEFAKAALAGLRSVLEGKVRSFEMEYPCHAPGQERWFVLRVTPLSGNFPARLVVSHQDVSEAKRMRDRIERTMRTLEQVLATLPVGVWIMDASGRIVNVNPAGERIWAGSRFIGPEQFGEYRGWWLATGELITAEQWAGARAIRLGEVSVDEEIEIECFDGTRKIILNSAMPLRGPGGEIQGAIIVNQDITARKQAEAELRRSQEALQAAHAGLAEALAREQSLARMDPLTGIGNRRTFFEQASESLDQAQHFQQPLAVILFDVDHFKRINDLLGHHQGDETLRRIVEIAHASLRPTDLLARYGGEEFVVLLPHTSLREAAAVAERLREAVAARALAPGPGALPPLTISCGVAAVRPGDVEIEAAVKRADDALYTAKREGRNRIVLQPD